MQVPKRTARARIVFLVFFIALVAAGRVAVHHRHPEVAVAQREAELGVVAVGGAADDVAAHHQRRGGGGPVGRGGRLLEETLKLVVLAELEERLPVGGRHLAGVGGRLVLGDDLLTDVERLLRVSGREVREREVAAGRLVPHEHPVVVDDLGERRHRRRAVAGLDLRDRLVEVGRRRNVEADHVGELALHRDRALVADDGDLVLALARLPLDLAGEGLGIGPERALDRPGLNCGGSDRHRQQCLLHRVSFHCVQASVPGCAAAPPAPAGRSAFALFIMFSTSAREAPRGKSSRYFAPNSSTRSACSAPSCEKSLTAFT